MPDEIARLVRGFVALVIALALAACGSEAERSRPAGRRRDAGRPQAEAPAFVDGERRLMGTIFVIRTIAPREQAEPAIDAAFAEIARLEGVLSEWTEGTEISRINAGAGNGQPIPVSADTWSVVSTGLAVSRASEGAFDLSWAALRGLYDFRSEHPHEADPAEIRRRLPLVRWQDVIADEATQSVHLRRRNMAIGTGAIGKGYALDRASEILRAAGVEDFMIYGGGQVQVHGRRGDRPWRVGIQHPRENRLVASFEAGDVSISTSGDYEHSFFTADGRRFHHIVDPATGLPARKSISVTVISPNGMRADALSTAVFVLGPDAGLAMLQSYEPRAEAVIIGADCALHVTPGLRERLRFELPLEAGDVVPDCRGRP